MSANKGSKSDSVPAVKILSESDSELEEEVFEEQSQNVLFAFEPVWCLGETDISRCPTNTNRSSNFQRLNGLEW